MTAFDRIEQRMPELMAELAPASVPDYFDDMLRQTGRTRQRPAWASLERWLPMDVAARPAAFRAPALRPLVILLLIALLIAGGVLLYAGSQRTRLPAPFGPARNGLIVATNADQDITAIDPVTGSTTPLIAGPTKDIAPWFSRDGQHFMFVRLTGRDVGAYWVANADGSGARQLVGAPVDWFEWSDAGDRIVVVRLENDLRPASIVRVADGTVQPLTVPQTIDHAFWRPGHDQLLFTTQGDQGKLAYFLVNADGTGQERIAGVSPDAVNDPQFSADGSQLVYATWGRAGSPGSDPPPRHRQRRRPGADVRGLGWAQTSSTRSSHRMGSRCCSSATSRIRARRWLSARHCTCGRAVPPPRSGLHIQPETDGATTEFSPDGTQVLATYNDDGSTWLLDVDGSGERQLPVLGGGTSWQRLAP